MSDKLLNIVGEIDPERHVLLAGPTASGKSALALALAERQGGTIVNADALQVFACWRILTARPTAADLARADHALYGHVSPFAAYSVGHWLREVSALLARGERLILVGGTGLYFSALTEGLVEIPPVPAAIRAEATRLVTDLAAMLAELDAPTRARIDCANPARVQRAWEVLTATGRGLAAWQDATGAPLLPPDQVTKLVLIPEREWLGTRIDGRFDAMIAADALAEVSAALPGWSPVLPYAKAIGAFDLVAYLHGELTLAEAIMRSKLASRQYAKRQRSWFRSRMKDWRAVNLPG